MFKVFWNEIKNIFKNKWVASSVILLLILPFLFTFLQISANWNPFGNSQNVNIAIVNMDGNNIYADQAVKGIIKTDENIKLSGTNEKYNLNVKQIYLSNQSDVQSSLDSGEYDAIYVIPKGYENNQINGISNLINKKIDKLSSELNTPGYLVKNPNISKIIFNGIDNFIDSMKNVSLSNNQQAFFNLLFFFIRNSRLNTECVAKYNSSGIFTPQLENLDKKLSKLTNHNYDNTKINEVFLAQFLTNIFPPDTFLSRINYQKMMFPLINGMFLSFLTNNDNFNFHSNFDKSKSIQLYLSNQNSPLSSEMINMLTNSPNMISNIYSKLVLKDLGDKITDKILPSTKGLITQMLSNISNFIIGYNDHSGKHIQGIMEILYPKKDATQIIIRDTVKLIFSPLKNPTFLWPYLTSAINETITSNVTNFKFNTNSLINYKLVKNNKKTFGQIITPNLIALAMWLSLIGFTFISRNKRIKSNKHATTLQHYGGKLLLYISIGIIQCILMIVPLIIFGVTNGVASWYLLLFGFVITIILSAIAEAIAFLSRVEISIILATFILLTLLTVAYGIFPLELESKWFSWINYLSPTKYLIDCFNNIMTNSPLSTIFISISPILGFTLIIPIAIIVNIKFDKYNQRKYGKYIDFAYHGKDD